MNTVYIVQFIKERILLNGMHFEKFVRLFHVLFYKQFG